MTDFRSTDGLNWDCEGELCERHDVCNDKGLVGDSVTSILLAFASLFIVDTGDAKVDSEVANRPVDLSAPLHMARLGIGV